MRAMMLLLLPLAACGGTNAATRAMLANPASVFCTEQGGHLVIRQRAGSAKGYCLLPDGRALDEWEYYRQMHP